MVFLSLQSLQDLCGIRVAYLMWSRHDLFERVSKEKLFEHYVDIVMTDTQNLPLPKKVKQLMSKHVRLTGKYLLSLHSFWFSKTRLGTSEKYLTGEMLYGSLTLNGDGMINQRKTAERLLSSRMLNNVFAFRLACVNFLEKELLMLWPHVKMYFLNNLILESENYNASCDDASFLKSVGMGLIAKRYFGDQIDLTYHEIFDRTEHSPLTMPMVESDEVLFWIRYCAAKENGIDMKEIPPFTSGCGAGWYEYSLESAALSGNVACFDYFNSIRDAGVKCDYFKMLEQYFSPRKERTEYQLDIFVRLFFRLNSEEKADLFRKYPKLVVCHFLEWPLSLAFSENVEELWSLIPDKRKKWVICILFKNSFSKDTRMPSYSIDRYGVYHGHLLTATKTHSVEHHKNILIAVWEMSLDIYKAAVFELYLLPRLRKFEGDSEYILNIFKVGLKEIMHLFLTNAEAILDFYAEKKLDKSLRTIVTKYNLEVIEDGNPLSDPFIIYENALRFMQSFYTKLKLNQ